tara:strand:+ start:603 stop:1280 length:678 start_codon:yes stop_codon:yes gene_type:complete
MKHKPGHFKKLLKESLVKNLKEQRDVCAQLQATNPTLFNYCYTHCQMNISSLPSECPDNFETCCPNDHEIGCPEGMIDQDHELWPQCAKCWTDPNNATVNTGDDCECCRPIGEEGCPGGMIDDTHPDWDLCVKCYDGSTNGSDITGGPPECDCCRPTDTIEEKIICYKCKGQFPVAMQFPNNYQAWANFDFQGECPKGWTEDPDPCKKPETAGMGLPPRSRRRRY